MRVRNLKDHSKNLFVVGQYSGKNGTTFQVLDEETWTPYLLGSSEIEIVDGTFPSRWIESRSNDETVMTFPEFTAPNFWKKYFDNDADAVNIFEQVVVPLSKMAITCSHIEEPSKFSWANVLFLLQKKWCPVSTAIDLATIRVSNDGEKVEELELSGLNYVEKDEVIRLVSALAKSESMDIYQLYSAGLNWIRLFPQADSEIFGTRFEKEIKMDSQNS